jgi:hypothetical protein
VGVLQAAQIHYPGSYKIPARTKLEAREQLQAMTELRTSVGRVSNNSNAQSPVTAFVRVSGPPNSNFLVGYPGISATLVTANLPTLKLHDEERMRWNANVCNRPIAADRGKG